MPAKKIQMGSLKPKKIAVDKLVAKTKKLNARDQEKIKKLSEKEKATWRELREAEKILANAEDKVGNLSNAYYALQDDIANLKDDINDRNAELKVRKSQAGKLTDKEIIAQLQKRIAVLEKSAGKNFKPKKG